MRHAIDSHARAYKANTQCGSDLERDSSAKPFAKAIQLLPYHIDHHMRTHLATPHTQPVQYAEEAREDLVVRGLDHDVERLCKVIGVEGLGQCHLVLLQLLEPALHATERFCGQR